MQFGWQFATGRLFNNGTDGLTPASWWADMNYQLLIVPLLGATAATPPLPGLPAVWVAEPPPHPRAAAPLTATAPGGRTAASESRRAAGAPPLAVLGFCRNNTASASAACGQVSVTVRVEGAGHCTSGRQPTNLVHIRAHIARKRACHVPRRRDRAVAAPFPPLPTPTLGRAHLLARALPAPAARPPARPAS